MSFVRRMTVAAAALAVCAMMLPGIAAEARPAARRASGIPPYCVLIGGARGTSLPQICQFFDYQTCLQAAADLRGNCVVNIDFRGELPNTDGAAWSRNPR